MPEKVLYTDMCGCEHTIIYCPICGGEFGHRQALRQHLNEVHKEGESK